MSVLISTAGYDSHYVLTNHAESAACVMTTGIHEYCLALSAVPSFNSFKHVSFSFFLHEHSQISLSRSEIYLHYSLLVNRSQPYITINVYDDRFSQPHNVVLHCSHGYHDHFHGAVCFTDQTIAVLCPCCFYTLEDLGQCPVLG